MTWCCYPMSCLAAAPQIASCNIQASDSEGLSLTGLLVWTLNPNLAKWHKENYVAAWEGHASLQILPSPPIKFYLLPSLPLSKEQKLSFLYQQRDYLDLMTPHSKIHQKIWHGQKKCYCYIYLLLILYGVVPNYVPNPSGQVSTQDLRHGTLQNPMLVEFPPFYNLKTSSDMDK